MSLYLATPLAFYLRRLGSPGTIFVKFCLTVIRESGLTIIELELDITGEYAEYAVEFIILG